MRGMRGNYAANCGTEMPVSRQGSCCNEMPVTRQSSCSSETPANCQTAPAVNYRAAAPAVQTNGNCCNEASARTETSCITDIPTGSRGELLKYIDEVSFAAYEAALYLDTHPDCQNAMQYFLAHNEKRELALKEYEKLYGPLVLTQAGEEACGCSSSNWKWVSQPWPWEGGKC